MLHLILGPSGSGKTYWLRHRIAESVAQGDAGLLLLVPEQNTYQSERAVLTLIGSASTDVAEVVSFTRLAEMARDWGESGLDVAPDCVKIMVMRRAFRTVKGELRAYSRQENSPEFFRAVLELDEELHRSRITAESLRASADEVGGALSVRIRDLALLLSTYRAMLGKRFRDPLEDLDLLVSHLDHTRFFDGRMVFIDDFGTFTEQQFAVLERVLTQAKDVYVSLCTDGLDDPDGGMGLFSNIKRTASRLCRLAREHNVAVASPLVMEGLRRYRGSVIANVERMMRGDAVDLDCAGGSVTVCECLNSADETDFVARTIRRLVRCEGYRYRDFAVIARNMAAYQADLVNACERYRVPCFNDRRVGADSLALIRFVLNALDCAVRGYPAESVYPLIKSVLSPLSVEESSELEGYALLWNKRGRDWLSLWEDNPNGLEKERDEAALARIMASRDLVLRPVETLSSALKKNDPKASCRAVYDLLMTLKVNDRLAAYADRLDAEGDAYYADLHRRSWDVLMTALDNAVRALDGETCGPEEFYLLFSILLSASDVGAIPDRLDEVVVGSADRMRTGSPRVVFVIGANYGVFPATVRSGGLLSARDRRLLFLSDPDQPDYIREQSVRERFLAYVALTAPSESLYVTYSVASLEREKLSPSEFVGDLLNRLQGMSGLHFLHSGDTADDAFEGVLPAIERVCGERQGLTDSLADQLRDRGDPRSGLLNAPLRPNESFSVSPACAEQLVGADIRMSASRAEQYGKCPFSYFCKYALRAKPDQTVDFDASRSGTLIHDVLENILRDHVRDLDRLTADERRSEIERGIRRYADANFGGYDRLDVNFRYLLERVAVSLDAVLAHMIEELNDSEFRPEQFELSIGREGGPMLDVSVSGGTVRLVGSVDRVDVYRADGKTYIRVVDYKSGGKDFRLSDLLSGVNMQMLFYLFAVTDSGLYQDAEPAGILYMPVTRKSISRDDYSDDISRRKAKDERLRMKGLLLDDETPMRAMNAYGDSRYIQISTRSNYNVVSASAMELIRSYILRRIVDLGERLHRGQFGADPLKLDTYSTCKYCDYRAVCRRDDAVGRTLESLGTDDALNRMREEVSGDDVPAD